MGCQKQPIKYILETLKKVLIFKRVYVKISTSTGKGNPEHQKGKKMEKEMLIYMINHEENFDKAQGMLDMFNVIHCTRYGFLNKRVVRFDNPDGSEDERYAACHDVWCELHCCDID